MRKDVSDLQNIAQNISNVMTPGYKKQFAIQNSFAYQYAAADAQRHASQQSRALTLDPSGGALRNTRGASDVAIDDDGFFELNSAAGPIYTRRGELHVNLEGRLVGSQNLPVVGAAGDIVLTGAPYLIASNGDISQGGAVVAKLKLAHFRHAELLEPLGGGNYAQGGATVNDAPAAVRLHVGYLENSNVDSAHEMVSMTEAVRHFEAMQRVVQGYDEVLEKSIRKLGEF